MPVVTPHRLARTTSANFTFMCAFVCVHFLSACVLNVFVSVCVMSWLGLMGINGNLMGIFHRGRKEMEVPFTI